MKRLLIALALIPLLASVSTAQRSGEILDNEGDVIATVKGNILEVPRSYPVQNLAGIRIEFGRGGDVRNFSTKQLYGYVEQRGSVTYIADANRNRLYYISNNACYQFASQKMSGRFETMVVRRYSFTNGIVVFKYKDVPDYMPIVLGMVYQKYIR